MAMSKLPLVFAILVILFASITFRNTISTSLLRVIDEKQNPRSLADSHKTFYPTTKKGQELHNSLKFVSDLHSDALLWPSRNLSHSERGFVSLERLREGNIALQCFYSVSKVPMLHNYYSNSNSTLIDPISVLAFLNSYRTVSLLDRNLLHAKKLLELTQSDKNFQIIRTRDDLNHFLLFRQNYFLRSKKGSSAPVAGVLGIEGLHCLDNSIQNLQKLYDAGFRLIGLSHFFDTTIAGSATGEEKYGLTPFGREVLQEMERLQLIPDLAHTSPNTIDDVLKFSSLKPFVSHTGVKGTCNSSRNLGDEHIKAIAAKGGIIGIGFWDAAVCGTSPQDVIKAIRYTADLVGSEHVALGSDWDGSVKAILSSEHISQITEGLLLETVTQPNGATVRRFTDEAIEAIMGLNVKKFLLTNLPVN